MTTSKRIWELDALRGIMILCVVFIHLCFDLDYFLGIDLVKNPIIQLIMDRCGMSFVVLSGLCATIGRRSFRRGLQVFGCGMLMTAATAICLPSQTIVFGVLHCLGLCMLLYPLLRRAVERIPPRLGLFLFFLLFLCCFRIATGQTVGLFGWRITLPAALYQTPYLFWLGFPNPQFASADYYPLLPWVLLFLAGSCFGRLLRQGPVPACFTRPHSRVLAVLGRHTLCIYLLHQPVCFGLLLLIRQLLQR